MNYVYKGQFKKISENVCIPHGKGIMVAQNGTIYESYFKDFVPHGDTRVLNS